MKIFFPLLIVSIFLFSGCSTSAAIPPETVIPQTLIPAKTSIPPTPTQLPVIGSTQVSSKDGMVMMYVPEGEFTMGMSADAALAECQKFFTDCSRDWFTGEEPEHPVNLDAYWIDQTEVTNMMFRMFVNEISYQTEAEKAGFSSVFTGSVWEQVNGADWQSPQGPNSNLTGLEDHPVVQVSWNDASAYCVWAGRNLPTIAQWEKAARGTDKRSYPWENDPPAGNLVNFADSNTSFAWSNKIINDGYPFTSPVGSYPDGKSFYGAMDMAGNVREWVSDWYGSYVSGNVTNPQGPSPGDYRVFRGGSWVSVTDFLRSAFRSSGNPVGSDDNVGFRCAFLH
ncbi:MAG: formylglycine-generating enzyme family protein [Chloroflexi bacterium]|nr:formylglycine-generating enzyme family protein [Chloroflexota bacterium]